MSCLRILSGMLGCTKRDHCSLIFIPEHHMDVGMAFFVMVGGHPLQILHPDSIELCQGQNVAVNIVLPTLYDRTVPIQQPFPGEKEIIPRYILTRR